MNKRAYMIDIENYDGSKMELGLRITIGGQKNLKYKAKKETALEVVLDAVRDTGAAVMVLTEALTYKGNTNLIQDGSELYDLLVDNGYSGQEDFSRLFTGIAYESGMISAEIRDVIIKETKKTLEEAFADERKNVGELSPSTD